MPSRCVAEHIALYSERGSAFIKQSLRSGVNEIAGCRHRSGPAGFAKVKGVDMSKVIGIDLGTTNSCVAVMDSKDARVIENAEGGVRHPRWWLYGKWRAFGWAAGKASGCDEPGEYIFATKRLIGRPFADPMVKKDQGLVPYKIVSVTIKMRGSRRAVKKGT